jgi:hypothetical protein
VSGMVFAAWSNSILISIKESSRKRGQPPLTLIYEEWP